MRIGIFGLFGIGNLGNDGSLEALLAFLRAARPEAELHVICEGTGIVAERFGTQTVPLTPPGPRALWCRLLNRASLRGLSHIHALIKIRGIAKTFDVIIVPGTGMLDDFGERWSDMPYRLFRWVLGARLGGTPFAFVSIGAGPIRHPVSRWLMRSAAALATYRSYRDQNSKNYMDGIGLRRPADPVTPDLAFMLPVPDAALGTPSERPVIGLGVMGYAGWKHSQRDGEAIYRAYIGKIASFARWLLDEGYAVRLIIGDVGDIKAVAEVAALATKGAGDLAAHLRAENAGSLSDVMRQIGETELLVATRFHNVVCGLMMQRPLISISYAKKNDVLMADMGLGAFCQYIEELDLELLKEQFTRLMAERETYLPQIARQTGAYREQLEQQGRRLSDALL